MMAQMHVKQSGNPSADARGSVESLLQAYLSRPLPPAGSLIILSSHIFHRLRYHYPHLNKSSTYKLVSARVAQQFCLFYP